MTPKNPADPTNAEILGAVDRFADATEQRFEGVENRLQNMELTMVTKDYLERRLDERFTRFETRMVTKDYLDDKMSELRGDLVVLTRKEDTKLYTLVNILHDKRIIDDADVRRVERLEPFAR